MSPLFKAIGLVLAFSAPAFAQATAPISLDLELNALQPTEKGCKVTFLATNKLGAPLDRAGIETALFDADGAIDRIVNLDFKGLTEGKTKVLQFELADLPCDGIGRVLINTVSACEGTGLAPTACLDNLKTTTRPSITFGL
ncbi:MAG: hypothetical protein JWR51_2885 [Devosia sp.]|uniref:hypothetical protein n=1 Tax=Devosia sp. TaxID=1871048 RepID=UPI00261DFF20|nr:hypothetical protein [Devosia sp.]MDB5529782.1 hypothetical protein [Devosia sp.]